MAAPIVLAVPIQAPAEKISEAIATTTGLRAFWTTDSTAEPKAGSVATFGFGGPTLKMRVDEVTRGKRVAWTCLGDFPNWNGTTVTWDLSKMDTGEINVLFQHGNWAASVPATENANVAYTWALILRALKIYAETGKPEPVFDLTAGYTRRG